MGGTNFAKGVPKSSCNRKPKHDTDLTDHTDYWGIEMNNAAITSSPVWVIREIRQIRVIRVVFCLRLRRKPTIVKGCLTRSC